MGERMKWLCWGGKHSETKQRLEVLVEELLMVSIALDKTPPNLNHM